MGHRYYSRSNCRCVTRDPIGYAGGINLYAFCGNNSVNRVDPSGLQGLVEPPPEPPILPAPADADPNEPTGDGDINSMAREEYDTLKGVATFERTIYETVSEWIKDIIGDTKPEDLKCHEVSDAIRDNLDREGIENVQLHVKWDDAGSPPEDIDPRFLSDNETLLTNNSEHWGTMVDGSVYGPECPDGVSFDQWLVIVQCGENARIFHF